MNKRFLLAAGLWAAVVFLGGCGRRQEIRTVNLSEVASERLTGSVIPCPEEVAFAQRIFSLQGRFALLDDANEGFLHFYDAEWNPVCRFGRVGRAEDEFVLPKVLSSRERLYVFSVSGRYAELSFAGPDSLSVRFDAPSSPEGAEGLYYYVKYPSGEVVMSTSTEARMLVTAGQSKRPLDIFPVREYEEIGNFYKKEVIFESAYASSSKEETVLACGKYQPYIELFDIPGRRYECRRIADLKDNEVSFRNNAPVYESPVSFYTFATFSGEHYYALFQNAGTAEMEAGGISEVHKIDRSGEIVSRYILDRRVYSFCVEESTSAIAALFLTEDYEPGIVRYVME